MKSCSNSARVQAKTAPVDKTPFRIGRRVQHNPVHFNTARYRLLTQSIALAPLGCKSIGRRALHWRLAWRRDNSASLFLCCTQALARWVWRMHKTGVSSLPFCILSATFSGLPGIGSLRKSQINKARIAPAGSNGTLAAGRSLVVVPAPGCTAPLRSCRFATVAKEPSPTQPAAVTYGARLKVWRWAAGRVCSGKDRACGLQLHDASVGRTTRRIWYLQAFAWRV